MLCCVGEVLCLGYKEVVLCCVDVCYFFIIIYNRAGGAEVSGGCTGLL